MAPLRNRRYELWDWDTRLQAEGRGACFPRRITCANVDSETEINGHWLVLEGKRPGEGMPEGEIRTLDARVLDGRTVLVVVGDPDGELVAIQNWRTKGELKPATWADLWDLLKQWADWAQTQPRPEPRESAFILRRPSRARPLADPDEEPDLDVVAA